MCCKQCPRYKIWLLFQKGDSHLWLNIRWRVCARTRVCLLWESLKWNHYLLLKGSAWLGSWLQSFYSPWSSFRVIGEILRPLLPWIHVEKRNPCPGQGWPTGLCVNTGRAVPTLRHASQLPSLPPGRAGDGVSVHSPTWLAAPFCLSFSSTWHFFLAILWRIEAFSLNLPEARESGGKETEWEEESSLVAKGEPWKSMWLLQFCCPGAVTTPSCPT